MTNYGFLLVQRMTMLALLLAGFLSIQACQLNAPGPQKGAIASSSLSPIASVSADKVAASIDSGFVNSPSGQASPEESSPEEISSAKISLAIEPDVSLQQRPLEQSGPLAELMEKHFVIPVARSGDFAPDELDKYVLSIIKESRQWNTIAELQIHGHTDSEGSELSNMLLSIRRANRVAERFEELGVEAGLLLIEAHGETQPIADNTTLDGRIANRRIEVVLIGYAGKASDEQAQYQAVVTKRHAEGERL